MHNSTLKKPAARGLKRIINAGRYSVQGLHAAWQNEEAFRQELLLCLILIPSAFWLGQTPLHTVMLIAPCILVLISELANSAIETIVDHHSTEQHPLAGQAKDIGSAMVFVAITFTVLVWIYFGLHRFGLIT